MLSAIVEEDLLIKLQKGLPVTFLGSFSQGQEPLTIVIEYVTFCMVLGEGVCRSVVCVFF